MAAFRAVTRGLEEASTPELRLRAAGRNHDLWSTLVKDLAMQGNRLPDALKAELIAIGLWSMRYSTLAILKVLPLAPLIVVNRNIEAGLAAQTVRADVPAENLTLSGRAI